MPKSENQKIKMLRLYEYLRMESDEDHPKGMPEILKALQAQGIQCERKSVSSDIHLLKKYGYDIRTKGYKYYLATRELNLGEIRFLIDATQAATFLPVKQTAKICEALKPLAGTHQAELLDDQVICFDKVKRTNEEVLDTVEKINRAVENDCKVSFKYFDVAVGNRREYRKDGKRYTVNPMGLIFHDGRYYFVTYNEKYKSETTYRVDKISDMRIEEEQFNVHSPKEEQLFFGDLKDRMTAFGMWTDGQPETVTFLVEKSIVGDIYEKFGNQVYLNPKDENHYTFTGRVNLSHAFYGWCASYGPLVKILSPTSVKKEFIKQMQEAIDQY